MLLLSRMRWKVPKSEQGEREVASCECGAGAGIVPHSILRVQSSPVVYCSPVAWRLGGDRDVRSSQPTSTNRTWAQRNGLLFQNAPCVYTVYFLLKKTAEKRTLEGDLGSCGLYPLLSI